MIGLALLPQIGQAQTITYPIVDTGQSKCYNATTEITCPATGVAFDGRDAQYTGHTPSYTLSAKGVTVYDNATGLMWAQNDSVTGLNWEEALAWVETQNAANHLGYNDWRLPNAKELQSLVDYTRSPATDWT